MCCVTGVLIDSIFFVVNKSHTNGNGVQNVKVSIKLKWFWSCNSSTFSSSIHLLKCASSESDVFKLPVIFLPRLKMSFHRIFPRLERKATKKTAALTSHQHVYVICIVRINHLPKPDGYCAVTSQHT